MGKGYGYGYGFGCGSVLILLVCTLISPTLYSNDLTASEEYSSLLNYQQTDLQHMLTEFFPESEGYFVSGPLSPLLATSTNAKELFTTIRVIDENFVTDSNIIDCITRLRLFNPVRKYDWYDEIKSSCEIAGYRGTLLEIEWNNNTTSIQLLTPHQNRFLIWYGELLKENGLTKLDSAAQIYSAKISEYLAQIDSGYHDAISPDAIEFGLPEKYNLYAKSPKYVIDGYQNYKNYLFSHKEVKTKFAHGIIAFIPTDETLQWFKDNAPHKVFPNKERAKLQEEYRKFFRRGGQPDIMQTLTKTGFDTLKTGEYFFAIGINGNIRFAREIPREEVKRIEKENGQKVPRANHAFLFPGEPVLTAGAFFIDERAANKLVKVNAQSGHYFYSNITPSIREDIAELSDYYLLTLGHFFKALDRIGIPYDNILISKL